MTPDYLKEGAELLREVVEVTRCDNREKARIRKSNREVWRWDARNRYGRTNNFERKKERVGLKKYLDDY